MKVYKVVRLKPLMQGFESAWIESDATVDYSTAQRTDATLRVFAFKTEADARMWMKKPWLRGAVVLFEADAVEAEPFRRKFWSTNSAIVVEAVLAFWEHKRKVFNQLVQVTRPSLPVAPKGTLVCRQLQLIRELPQT